MTQAIKRIIVVEVAPDRVHEHRPEPVRRRMARASTAMIVALLLIVVSAAALAAFSAAGAHDYLGSMVLFAILGLAASAVLSVAAAVLRREGRLIHREEQLVKEIVPPALPPCTPKSEIVVVERLPVCKPSKRGPGEVVDAELVDEPPHRIMAEIELLVEERALLGRERRMLAEERRLLAQLVAEEHHIRRRLQEGFKKR